MPQKIKKALEKLIDDIGSIEVATLKDHPSRIDCDAYVKIGIDGDLFGFVEKNTPLNVQNTHIKLVKASIESRDIFLNFILGTLKNL